MVSLRRFFLCPLSIAALVALALATPPSAKADTFSVVALATDQEVFFYGMDDLGSVVLDSPTCGIHNCYYSFLNTVSTGTTFTAPSITMDNGSPCSPSVPAGGSVEHGVCNNGRDAFTGFLSASQVRPSIYFGGSFQNLFLNGGEGSIYMNALGDIVFDDHFTEEWYQATDLTAPPVPEPRSLLLMATGALGLAAFAMRRRSTI